MNGAEQIALGATEKITKLLSKMNCVGDIHVSLACTRRSN